MPDAVRARFEAVVREHMQSENVHADYPVTVEFDLLGTHLEPRRALPRRQGRSAAV